MGERADLRIETDRDSVYDENYDNKDPKEIREDIRRTRAEISETVDIIQARLDPERLKGQAQEVVREATIGRIENMANDISRRASGMGNGVMDTLKSNPIPAALMGIGLGWLLIESWNRSSESQDYWPRTRYYPSESSTHRYSEVYEPGDEYRTHSRVRDTFNEARAQGGQMAARVEDRAREMGNQARSKAEEMGDQVRGKAEEISDQVRNKAEEISHGVRHQVDHLAEEAQEQVEYIGQQARYAQGQVETMIESNPLAVGAAALALGLLVGFSLPATEVEDRYMGKTRDDLMDRAGDVAEDTMHKVERVAEEVQRSATETAKREAEAHNLTVADISKEVQNK